MAIKFQHFNDCDFEIVWNAYKDGSFDLPEVSKLQFAAWWIETKNKYSEILLVRHSGKYIAFVGAYFDGWRYEPHVEFFKCATSREKLESTIEFFSILQKLDTIGVVIVKALKPSVNLFEHVCKRSNLKFIGMIEKGDYRGDEFTFAVSGSATTRASPARSPTAGRF